jgi:hypothetical protein
MPEDWPSCRHHRYHVSERTNELVNQTDLGRVSIRGGQILDSRGEAAEVAVKVGRDSEVVLLLAAAAQRKDVMELENL